MKKNKLFEEVEKTLLSLDNIERARVSDDFDVVLAQKISFIAGSVVVKWLRYSAAAMITLAIVNVATLIFLPSNENSSRETYMELLGDEILYPSGSYLEIE